MKVKLSLPGSFLHYLRDIISAVDHPALLKLTSNTVSILFVLMSSTILLYTS